MSFGVILQLHDVIFTNLDQALGSCRHDVTNYLRIEAGGRKMYESAV